MNNDLKKLGTNWIRDEYNEQIGNITDIWTSSIKRGLPTARKAAWKYSKKIRMLDELNEKYGHALSCNDLTCGYVDCDYPETAADMDKMELLKACCCYNLKHAERILEAYRCSRPLYEDYLKQYEEICLMKTPPKDIPLDVDIMEFYMAEADLIKEMQIAKSFASLFNKRRCHEDDTIENMDPNAIFTILVTYNRISVWERENKRTFFGSMDPPWGEFRVHYTEEELVTAIRYAILHCGIDIPNDSGYNPNYECPFCGRDLEDCGHVGLYKLLDSGKTFRLPVRKPQLTACVPACSSCIDTWRMEFNRISKVDEWRNKFINMDILGWNVERVHIFTDFLDHMKEICQEALEKYKSFDIDGNPDPKQYLDRLQDSDDRWFRHYSVYGEFKSADALLDLADIELSKEDESVIEAAVKMHTARAAAQKLNQYFAKMIRSLPELIYAGETTIPVIKDLFERGELWSRSKQKDEENRIPDEIINFLSEYAVSHKDEIFCTAKNAAYNRHLYVRYAKAIRSCLSHFENIENVKTVDFPVRCFYAVAGLDGKHDTKAYAWSLEKMAEYAGFRDLPGCYGNGGK